jgi:hypothetical protein
VGHDSAGQFGMAAALAASRMNEKDQMKEKGRAKIAPVCGYLAQRDFILAV